MFKKLFFLSVFLFLLWLLFFGLGDEIIYSKAVSAKIIPFALVFIGIPVSLYLLLSQALSGSLSRSVAAASVIATGIAFGLWADHMSVKDLEENGSVTYGIISYKKLQKGKWSVVAEFRYKSKQYSTFAKDDTEDIYDIGDRVSVRFSKRNPENNELMIGN